MRLKTESVISKDHNTLSVVQNEAPDWYSIELQNCCVDAGWCWLFMNGDEGRLPAWFTMA